MNQIHLPLGMRDSILDEVSTKRELKARIESVFEQYGYKEIITPSIEFFETYQNAFSNLNSNSMYKFFDNDGNILSLRMDMTVPIARVCASKFKEADIPLRFRYCSNVYKVRQAFAGKRSEVTDCGIELIGLDKNSDIEVLMCALDTMKSIGIGNYTLEIGNSNFFKTACHLLEFDEEIINDLASLIDRKSMVELKAYLNDLELSEKVKLFFLELPLLNGKFDALKKAEALCFDKRLKDEVEQLMALFNNLSKLGYGEHITFDLGKVPHLDYYTGIIFEGFVEGVGVSVLSGGRYDNLLSKFDYDMPACGFSIKLDYLLDVVVFKEKKACRLYYPLSKQMEALALSCQLRKDKAVELVVYDGDEVILKEEDE